MKNTKGGLVLAGAMSLLLAGAGQAAEVPLRGPIPFAVYDLDGDGAVTEQEFNQVRNARIAARTRAGMPVGRADAPIFPIFDRDSDGRITREEFAEARRMRQQMQPGEGAGRGAGGRAAGPGRNLPAFNEFDLDGDGLIQRDEFHEARNRRIGERASQGYPMRGLADISSFEAMDADRDGNVSPDEFVTHQRSHLPPR